MGSRRTPPRRCSRNSTRSRERRARGKPRKDRKTGETILPKEYKRSGGTVNRYIACLSHALSVAVKVRRLLDRNPKSDSSRKKDPRGRACGPASRARLASLSRPSV